MTTDKENKRKARKLSDDAREAFEAGDYHRVRELNEQVLSLVPDTDLGAKARVAVENTKVEPYTLYGGIFFSVLYTIGWIVALTS